MKSRHSYPAPGSSRSQGSGEAEDVAGEVTSSWTGEKKAKIESAPTLPDTEEIDRARLRQQIEGFGWDKARLQKEVDKCCVQMKWHCALPDKDDGFWAYHDEQGLRNMNQRLALYRLRGLKPELKDLGDSELLEQYSTNHLEEYGYYKLYESKLEWYFDPQYCNHANLQDYQRLMLRNNGEYDEWDHYREVCSTLEGDQEFVMFWEKLSNETKWIENFLTTNWDDWELVAYYHTMKIAAGYTNIFETLTDFSFSDYLFSFRYDKYFNRDMACILFEIWKLDAKQKVNFKDALEQVKDKALQSFCCAEMAFELTSNEEYPGPITCQYYNHMAHIDETVSDGEAQHLIMEAVKKCFQVPKRKVYYDYAKKKLEIAANIGLIQRAPGKRST